MDGDRELLDEQVAYCRARASEYDATSVREGIRWRPMPCGSPRRFVPSTLADG
jgi:hypothetical protein